MIKTIVILFIILMWMPVKSQDNESHNVFDTRNFYVDSGDGNDSNTGLSESNAFQSLDKISNLTFKPNDRILFKRGSSYSGCVTVYGNGSSRHPITIGAYGDGEAPRFTNNDNRVCNGNAMRIRGDYQVVEDLYFHHTAPAPSNSGFLEVWASGALHVGLGYDYVIIRNNEFAHNAKAIQSYSEYSLITENYIHGINELQQEGFLSFPHWGPIGIQLGIGNQEISYNIIEDMYVEGGAWGGDGGAIEIDDGRNHKNNIYIHHNQTQHNMGFLEISWEHDIRQMLTSQIVVERNVSRDFQSFVLWWAENSNSQINNNTIIRTDSVNGMALDTVFMLEGQDIFITDNIIVVSDNMWGSVFLGDASSSSLRTNNVYWNIDGGKVRLGVDPNQGEFTADPQFVDFANGNYELTGESTMHGYGVYADETLEPDIHPVRLMNFEFEDDDYMFRDPNLISKSQSDGWMRIEEDDLRLGVDGGDSWSDPRNSGGTTLTLWNEGDSLSVLFEGTQVRFYGLRSDYMTTADILIDGITVVEDLSMRGTGDFQSLLWESDILEYDIHRVTLISNGDTVEVDFIEIR